MKHVPLSRPAAPRRSRKARCFSPERASYVNGHCLTIDGGWTAGYMM
jgi:NAD(P)-dependent dehydrogenase (short-subunit alcohol dehydrogenase family)